MESGDEVGEEKTAAAPSGKSHAGEAAMLNKLRLSWADGAGAAGCGSDSEELDWPTQQ